VRLLIYRTLEKHLLIYLLIFFRITISADFEHLGGGTTSLRHSVLCRNGFLSVDLSPLLLCHSLQNPAVWQTVLQAISVSDVLMYSFCCNASQSEKSGELLFLVYYCFTKLMQRIFKYDIMQHYRSSR